MLIYVSIRLYNGFFLSHQAVPFPGVASMFFIRPVVQSFTHEVVKCYNCVLDGVRSIENSLDKGQLSLYYQKDDINELLNDPEGITYMNCYEYIATKNSVRGQ